MKQKQTGSIKVALIIAATLAVLILIGRHISAQSANNLSKISPKETTTATVKPVTVENECANNKANKEVLVSISVQHMWACDGTKIANQAAVTTGASNAPNGVNNGTPIGTWHIYEKFRNLHLRGSDKNGPWDDYVQYWMPFYTAVGFHDASWQTFPFGSPQYKTNGSHGCVQLPTGMAAWLYGWAPIGTTVVIQ